MSMRFETGKTYTCRSACDYDTIFEYTVERRTQKSVWIDGERKGVKIDQNGNEFCYPDGRYSMCPVIRADKPQDGPEEEATPQRHVPVSVLVHWSESELFDDEREYPFSEFESRAIGVAMRKGASNGYDKTKITVNFDTGETYSCRLDLAQDDDQNFAHRCMTMLYWWNNGGKDKYQHNQAFVESHEKCLNFIRSIEWRTF